MRRQLLLCLALIVLLGSAGFAAEGEAPPPVKVDAPSAMLMEAGSGLVLYSKNEREIRPPASVTKLMVLLLAMEALDGGKIKLTDTITASPEACSKGGSQIWLEQGEQMTVGEILKAVAIVSANDASVALGEHLAGSEENFVRLMNKRAAELGMKDTTYVNATGLSPDDRSSKGNLTSVRDQTILAREVLRHPDVLRWTGTWIDHLRGGQSFLRNTNNLVRFYEGCDGLKTGFTEEAGYCLVATAKRNGVRLIATVMKSRTSKERNADISRLLNYGFGRLKAVQYYKGGEILGQVKVALGRQSHVPVAVARELAVVMERDATETPKKAVILPLKVNAPVRKGTVLGRIVLSLKGSECGRVNLIAAENVERSGFFETFFKVLGQAIGGFFRKG